MAAFDPNDVAAACAELGVGAAELAAIKQKFATFDADGSGTIDADELALLLEEMGGAYTPAEVRMILTQIDTDKSSVIEFIEFLRWWAGGSDDAPAPSPAPTPNAKGTALAPSSADGPVLMLAHNSPDAIVQRVFDAVDTDRSGAIEKPEFIALLTQLGILSGDDSEEDEGLLDDELYTADEDGNELIDAAEFAKWYHARGAEIKGVWRATIDVVAPAAPLGPDAGRASFEADEAELTVVWKGDPA